MNGVFFFCFFLLQFTALIDFLSRENPGRKSSPLLKRAEYVHFCYPARPDQLRFEAIFLPPCIYLFILMSLQTARGKAVRFICRADVRPRCGTAWHGMARGAMAVLAGWAALGSWPHVSSGLHQALSSALLLPGRCCKPKVTQHFYNLLYLCVSKWDLYQVFICCSRGKWCGVKILV